MVETVRGWGESKVRRLVEGEGCWVFLGEVSTREMEERKVGSFPAVERREIRWFSNGVRATVKGRGRRAGATGGGCSGLLLPAEVGLVVDSQVRG
ncbi:hypothetical protein HAX54_040034 [Datura stramonium]|uniref:Uncharacterized protein n=1 Tax=Datura stramonium TaxID=4076 RepID=A0ABS8SJH7_DATST|nr:hypothetical protein [Datura stramonium]